MGSCVLFRFGMFYTGRLRHTLDGHKKFCQFDESVYIFGNTSVADSKYNIFY